MSLPDTKIYIDSKPTIDQPKSLELNVKILTSAGLWPLKMSKRTWQQTLGYVYPRISLVSSTIILISQIVDALSGNIKMEELTENIYVSLVITMAIVKTSTILLQGNEFENFVSKLNAMNTEGLRDVNQRRIFDRYKRYTEWMTKGFLVMCGGTCISYLGGPILHSVVVRPLPHRGYLPWNTTVTPNYQLTFAWWAGQTVANTFLIGMCDTLFVSTLICAIGQFKVLHYKLENVRKIAVNIGIDRKKAVDESDHNHRSLMIPLSVADVPDRKKAVDTSETHRLLSVVDLPDEESKPAYSGRKESERMRKIHLKRMEKRFYKKLGIDLKGKRRKVGPTRSDSKVEKKGELPKFEMNTDVCQLTKEEMHSEMEQCMFQCAEHHQQILSFANDIESLFNLMVACQFMGSLSLFCMVAYQTTKSGPEDPKYLALLQLLVSAITELFMFCWCSAELTDQSLKVNEAVYMCKWENRTPCFNHALQMVLLRANMPVCITVARFVPLDLEIFRRITKTSYSFYTLLTQLDSDFNGEDASKFSRGYSADSLISSNF